MNCKKVDITILEWLTKQIEDSKKKGFVIGVSGGVDSALVSTLCAQTNFPTLCLNMPIRQAEDQKNRAEDHIAWLKTQFQNIDNTYIDLTNPYQTFMDKIGYTLYKEERNDVRENFDLMSSNVRSRLRMVTLYSFANVYDYLVVGTGNKVEDYGVGFFTKFGDGGVDISPIGDLLKSEVRELAKWLGVSEEIVNAIPTDGLWNDNRSDEQQIGATYDELEWAMENYSKYIQGMEAEFTKRQKEVLKIYMFRHEGSKHKMNTPLICSLERNKA